MLLAGAVEVVNFSPTDLQVFTIYLLLTFPSKILLLFLYLLHFEDGGQKGCLFPLALYF